MVRITTDSTVDLGELFEKRNIPFIPLIVTLGTESLYDIENVTPDDIYAYVAKTKQLPKTAARSKEDYIEFYKNALAESGADSLIHIGLSSKLSVSFSSSLAAAEEMGNVSVIDGKSLSTGTGLLVLYADDLAKAGKSHEEIIELVSARVDSVQASFVVDTMEYLHKGGRCSSIVSIAATVLKIKPSIYLKEGKMLVGKKYMGSLDKSIMKYVGDTLSTHNKPDLTRIFITHTSAAPEIVESVKKRILEIAPFTEVIETIAGSTITSHCGKGTLGILYINDGEPLQ